MPSLGTCAGLGTVCYRQKRSGQVGSRHGIDGVERAVSLLGGGPLAPAHVARENGFVVLAGEQGLILTLMVEVIKVLEEKQPGGLLDVVELGGASRLVAQDIVYRIECRFVLHESVVSVNSSRKG